ncbi:MAG: hypothetical protein PVI03_01390 [Candidatus Thorarchaeota archaeon]|jgi:hypothetical protein
MVVRSRVWKHKVTGRLSTAIPILQINEWDEIKHPTKEQYKKAERNKLKMLGW